MLQLPKCTTNLRMVKRNRKFFERIYNAMIVFILILTFSIFVRPGSLLFTYIDYGLFLLIFYIVLSIFYVWIKYIDSLNLYNDFTIWVVRIVGGLAVLFGFILIFSSQIVMTYTYNTPRNLVFNNIYWIIGFAFILLGAFCEFRSTRRYGMFLYRGN